MRLIQRIVFINSIEQLDCTLRRNCRWNLLDYQTLILAYPPAEIRESKMKRLTILAVVLGAALVAGCSVSTDGTSLSDAEWVDNNCSGNGFVVNASWCADTLHPSAGPYAANK
jgi:predicted small secreted protein